MLLRKPSTLSVGAGSEGRFVSERSHSSVFEPSATAAIPVAAPGHIAASVFTSSHGTHQAESLNVTPRTATPPVAAPAWYPHLFALSSEAQHSARALAAGQPLERPQHAHQDMLPELQMEQARHAGGLWMGTTPSYNLLPTADHGDSSDDSAASASRWAASPAKAFVHRARKVLASPCLHSIVAALILLNAVVIGFETDDPQHEDAWDLVERLLLFCFVMELGLRLLVVKSFFHMSNPDFFWNTFDFFLVGIGLVDFVLSEFCEKSAFGAIVQGGHSTGVATVFRVFRILRILRVIRLVRFLKQLYILSYGFLLAAEAVLWVSVLMTASLYVCSILLVRVGQAEIGEGDTETSEFWRSHFGSVSCAMFTLFQLMVQPNLTEYEVQLMDKPLFTIFIVVFIIFGSFGMIALLTGVISEAMFQKNQVKLEEERQDRETTRSALLDYCKQLFDDFAEDGSEEMSDVQVRSMLPRIQEMFDLMHVRYTAHELEDMLQLMDLDGSGSINKSEFCRCLLHIAENSEDLRPMLMMELHYDSMSFLKGKLAEFQEHMKVTREDQQRFQKSVQGDMSELMRHVRSRPESLGGGSPCDTVSACRSPARDVDARAADAAAADAAAGARAADVGGSGDDGGGAAGGAVSSKEKALEREVHALHGHLFALAGRVEELLGDAASERTNSQMQELFTRRRCMAQESAVATRMDRLEAEVRQLRALVTTVASGMQEQQQRARAPP